MFSNRTRPLPSEHLRVDEIKPVMVASPRPTGVPSIISADMTIRGNLKCAGRLQIEGTVLGDIEVGQLVISDGAVVQGEIDAQEVEISGTLTGLVRAREITLKATARVVGDLYQEVLAIDPGAQLEGQCRRLSSETAGAASGRTETSRSDGSRSDTSRADLSIPDRLQLTKELLRGVA
jgi:cytoskeletal protein CcmA (bactofilin family)